MSVRSGLFGYLREISTMMQYKSKFLLYRNTSINTASVSDHSGIHTEYPSLPSHTAASTSQSESITLFATRKVMLEVFNKEENETISIPTSIIPKEHVLSTRGSDLGMEKRNVVIPQSPATADLILSEGKSDRVNDLMASDISYTPITIIPSQYGEHEEKGIDMSMKCQYILIHRQ